MAKQIIVQPGETLSGIAQRELGSALRWKELGEQIGITTEEQAKLLQPGATLTIPTEEIKEPFASPITPERKTLEEKIGKVETELKEKKELLEKAKAYPYLKPKEEIPDWILEAESPEEVATLAKPARIKELEQLAFAAPTKTWEEIFKEAYDTAGLKNIKTRIKKFDDKITKIKDDLVSAEGKINENPWLTETGRVGRVKRLYDMAQKEINNLVEQRKSLVEEYKTGVSSAEKVAEETLKKWETQTKLYKTELDYLTKTEKGEEYLSVAEAKALGLPYGTKKAEAMEKGIVPAKTAKSWIEFSDTEKRKLTVAGIDWTTSEGFSQALQYLYPLGEKNTNADRINEVSKFMTSQMGTDGFISAGDYVESQRKWIGMGGTITDFKAAFPPESVMGGWELPKLPSSIWKAPKGGISNEDLIE